MESRNEKLKRRILALRNFVRTYDEREANEWIDTISALLAELFITRGHTFQEYQDYLLNSSQHYKKDFKDGK
jgi:hypothetical protein